MRRLLLPWFAPRRKDSFPADAPACITTIRFSTIGRFIVPEFSLPLNGLPIAAARRRRPASLSDLSEGKIGLQ